MRAPILRRSLSLIAVGIVTLFSTPALAQTFGWTFPNLSFIEWVWVIDEGGNNLVMEIELENGNITRNGFLFVHTTGTQNTFVGEDAGNVSTITGASQNSAFGKNALTSITNGSQNAAFGHIALSSTTTGSWNAAFGAIFRYVFAILGL